MYQLWLVDELVGKVAGVFATGGGYRNASSGVELTQIAMLGSLAECGMILVPFPKSALGSENTGSRWGSYARSGGSRMEPDEIPETMCWKEVANMVISAWISNAVDWWSNPNYRKSSDNFFVRLDHPNLDRGLGLVTFWVIIPVE